MTSSELKSYENKFLSSNDFSQNITNSANVVWSNRNMMSSVNNKTKLRVDDIENTSRQLQKHFRQKKLIEIHKNC